MHNDRYILYIFGMQILFSEFCSNLAEIHNSNFFINIWKPEKEGWVIGRYCRVQLVTRRDQLPWCVLAITFHIPMSCLHIMYKPGHSNISKGSHYFCRIEINDQQLYILCRDKMHYWINSNINGKADRVHLNSLLTPSSFLLAKAPIRFPPLPLGGFRQVFKHSAIRDWHRSHRIYRYCMVYKWSILCHSSTMCSFDIYKRIGTSPVTPLPAYRMRTMSVAY